MWLKAVALIIAKKAKKLRNTRGKFDSTRLFRSNGLLYNTVGWHQRKHFTEGCRNISKFSNLFAGIFAGRQLLLRFGWSSKEETTVRTYDDRDGVLLHLRHRSPSASLTSGRLTVYSWSSGRTTDGSCQDTKGKTMSLYFIQNVPSEPNIWSPILHAQLDLFPLFPPGPQATKEAKQTPPHNKKIIAFFVKATSRSFIFFAGCQDKLK